MKPRSQENCSYKCKGGDLVMFVCEQHLHFVSMVKCHTHKPQSAQQKLNLLWQTTTVFVVALILIKTAVCSNIFSNSPLVCHRNKTMELAKAMESNWFSRWGSHFYPGRTCANRSNVVRANVTALSGKAKQLSAPTLHGSPFGTLTRRAKCAKIRNSTGTLCRSMCQQSFTRKIQPKTPSEPGELQARTICHSQKLFVK